METKCPTTGVRLNKNTVYPYSGIAHNVENDDIEIILWCAKILITLGDEKKDYKQCDPSFSLPHRMCLSIHTSIY